MTEPPTTSDFVQAENFYAASAEKPANGNADAPPVEEQPAIVFLAHDDLFSPEPENENLVVSALGIGSGPPVGVFGQGFVGKTILSMSLGMSVALGRPLWGQYPVSQGVWVHFDYEQGRRETKKRVQLLARGFGVWRGDLQDRMRVAVYPETNLTSPEALKHYVEAMSGASIATIDALKGITPGIEENSSAMRDYIRTLSLASEKTGCAVVLIHHAGKFDGKKARKEMGRGSSAIYDECQSVFVVTGERDQDKRVTHEKDRELGSLVPEFALRFEDVPCIGDVDSDDDVSLDDTEKGLRVTVIEGLSASDRIVSFLDKSGGTFAGSKTALVGEIGMNRSECYAGLAVLESKGRVRVEKKSVKEGRPQGRISLVPEADGENSPVVPDSPEDVGTVLIESPKQSRAPSFKDGRDCGTISFEDV